MEQNHKSIYAFISYNHEDVRWAKWLRKKLEWYKLPTEIDNDVEDSRYIRPVFRDRDELNSGVLGHELRKCLENSKYLIVICSPNSAKSEWVSNEVQAFIDMGRQEYIIPFIVEGSPHNYLSEQAAVQPLMEECFPFALRKWNMVNPVEQLLGISVDDDGEIDRHKAFVRIVSRLIGVSFDTLWQRYKRELRLKLTIRTMSIILTLVLSYWFMIPVTVDVSITEDKVNLPEMTIGKIIINGGEYPFPKGDTLISIDGIPGYLRLNRMPISFVADRYYDEKNETFMLTAGIKQTYDFKLERDSTFAFFAGTVFEDFNRDGLHPVSGAIVSIGNKHMTTDSTGHFSFHFEIGEQTVTKSIVIEKDGYTTICRNDETPSQRLKYIMHHER